MAADKTKAWMAKCYAILSQMWKVKAIILSLAVIKDLINRTGHVYGNLEEIILIPVVFTSC